MRIAGGVEERESPEFESTPPRAVQESS